MLNETLIECRLCPRLVEWRERVATEKRKSFQDDVYWGRPVPNFGDPDARHLIVGLAPAAHGANRTGRMFTGDRSGEWLYRALHKASVASSPESQSIADGLVLTGVMITAVCHCAPPDNKPTTDEIFNCSTYLNEIIGAREWNSILCLGGIAWREVFRTLRIRAPKFGHGVVTLVGTTLVVGSYHPSQQNTFTGRLTEAMLDSAISTFLKGYSST